MIQIEANTWEIHCDGCPEADARDADDFSFVGFVQEMRRAGWLSLLREEDEWEHFCPDCAERREREEFRAFTPKQRSRESGN